MRKPGKPATECSGYALGKTDHAVLAHLILARWPDIRKGKVMAASSDEPGHGEYSDDNLPPAHCRVHGMTSSSRPTDRTRHS